MQYQMQGTKTARHGFGPPPKRAFGRGKLDTLAQDGQDPQKTLKNRARAKYLTYPISVGLSEYAKGADSPLEKAYRNTSYCAGVVEQGPDGECTSDYCKNRWCLVCARIKTARLMNDYLPELGTWPDPQFVTLTVPNVPADELPATLDDMGAAFTAARRRARRTLHGAFRAVRKTEVTYSPSRGDYHPHFHVVIDGEQLAHELVSSWLRAFPAAVREAQDVRPADAGALRELFKYFTKLVAYRGGKRSFFKVAALDQIFRAMYRRPVFARYGFKVGEAAAAAEDDEMETVQSVTGWKRLGERIMWNWEQDIADWVDHETGETLSDAGIPDDVPLMTAA